MVGSLVKVHFLEQLRLNGAVEPGNVPVRLLFLCQMILEECLSDLFDHIIVRVATVHGDSVRLGPAVAILSVSVREELIVHGLVRYVLVIAVLLVLYWCLLLFRHCVEL